MHFSKQKKSYWIHMLHWTIDKTCSAQTHQTLEKILCPLRVSNKDWPVCVCHLNLCIGETVARVRSCVICMTEHVTVKENSSFSYRIPLMVWGPPALCRYSHQTTAKCGRLYKVVYPLSSCLCPPAYGIKPQPKVVTLLTTHDLLCSGWSTTEHSIQQKINHNAQKLRVYACMQGDC